MANGYSDTEISDELSMSVHTVKFHVSNLLEKTGCITRTELAIIAAKSGIVVGEK